MKKLVIATVAIAFSVLGASSVARAQSQFREFGVSGTNFKPDNLYGGWVGGEAPVYGFITKQSREVWYIDFAPIKGDQTDLDHRQIRMVRISADVGKRCGLALPEFQAPPRVCIAEERMVRWPQVKYFLANDVGLPEQGENYASLSGIEDTIRRYY